MYVELRPFSLVGIRVYVVQQRCVDSKPSWERERLTPHTSHYDKFFTLRARRVCCKTYEGGRFFGSEGAWRWWHTIENSGFSVFIKPGFGQLPLFLERGRNMGRKSHRFWPRCLSSSSQRFSSDWTGGEKKEGRRREKGKETGSVYAVLCMRGCQTFIVNSGKKIRKAKKNLRVFHLNRWIGLLLLLTWRSYLNVPLSASIVISVMA